MDSAEVFREWWLHDMTERDRRHIKKKSSMLHDLAQTMAIGAPGTKVSGTPIGFFAALLGRLHKPEDAGVGQKIIAAAEQIISDHTDPLDAHFYYHGKIEFRFAHRTRRGGEEKFLEACRQQIAWSPRAARAFQDKWPDIPQHEGFERLTKRLSLHGADEESIALCERAMAEGWAGDWQRRIDEYRSRTKNA